MKKNTISTLLLIAFLSVPFSCTMEGSLDENVTFEQEETNPEDTVLSSTEFKVNGDRGFSYQVPDQDANHYGVITELESDKTYFGYLTLNGKYCLGGTKKEGKVIYEYSLGNTSINPERYLLATNLKLNAKQIAFGLRVQVLGADEQFLYEFSTGKDSLYFKLSPEATMIRVQHAGGEKGLFVCEKVE